MIIYSSKQQCITKLYRMTGERKLLHFFMKDYNENKEKKKRMLCTYYIERFMFYLEHNIRVIFYPFHYIPTMWNQYRYLYSRFPTLSKRGARFTFLHLNKLRISSYHTHKKGLVFWYIRHTFHPLDKLLQDSNPE